MLLLQQRYSIKEPHSLQLVPDTHQGDLGLEAFSHSGHAYQCYAAKEPLSVAACFEKQRDKLTRDLAKLKAKSVELHAMLGVVQIRRYIFLVHRHDSRHLITHAQIKAAEVLSWELPFIDPTFAIVVETLKDYALEQEAVHAIPAPLVQIVPVAEEIKESWSAKNDALVKTAESKLGAIIAGKVSREKTLSVLLGQYLDGENALENLRVSSPDAYRIAVQTRSIKEGLLVLEHPPSNDAVQANLVTVAHELRDDLERANALLDRATAEKLAWAAVCDWLMRCPLDFGAPA
ncbi:hypothetical protein [Plantibacter cousiniae (nom. nud.)]|uniref:hypothetical protein n=1 Tax=Plantibacter cousiniae (nom. nud.) TaxID=199709 RepID=UPI001D723224|nr:hypothetical protein [Plantibacter cousiniae]CAH0178245.1 hypothetical protein SRABI02_01419 [Plantibacter cousiniae]